MFRATFRVTVTSTTTVHGMRNRITARFGIRRLWMSAGHLTAPVIGATLGRGAGRGLTIHLGVSLHSTMAVGPTLAAVGAGALVRITRVRFMDRRSSVSSAARIWGSVSAADLAAGLGGFPFAPAEHFIPGTQQACPRAA